MPRTSLMMRLETLRQQLVRQRRPVRGHEVGGLHRAQRHHVLVGAAVAHHADRAHRQEHGEGLRGLVVPAARCAQLLDEDRVGALQQLGVLALRPRPGCARPGPGPGNGWRNTISRGRPSARPSSRTSSLNSSRSGSSSFRCSVSGRPPTLWCDLIVMRLLGLGAGRLDHVGIDRALREPLRVRDLRRLALEHLDEQPADDLALLLRDRRRRQARRGTRSPASTWITLTPQVLARTSPSPARPRSGAAGRGRRTRR